MIEEHKNQTDRYNKDKADANPDPTIETRGVLVAGPEARSRVEKIDPAAEDAYWRTHYSNQEYVEQNAPYAAYQAAYRTGYEGRRQYPGKTYDEVEADLRRAYEKFNGNATLTWDKARPATRDAWNRFETVLPTDSDGDGR